MMSRMENFNDSYSENYKARAKECGLLNLDFNIDDVGIVHYQYDSLWKGVE